MGRDSSGDGGGGDGARLNFMCWHRNFGGGFGDNIYVYFRYDIMLLKFYNVAH